MSSQGSFTTIPGGRLFNLQYGQTANVDLGLNSEVSNVALLDFSPLAPWMTFDTGTGLFVADTTDSSTAPSSLTPGVYHFAVKGTMANVVYVEEYSVGVYETDESELATGATEYYFDDEENDYEEIVTYTSSFSGGNYSLK